MKYIRVYIAFTICVLCFVMFSLTVKAEETDEYILGDAWYAGQAVDGEQYTVSSDEKPQLFHMTGTVYYQKAYEALALVNQERRDAGMDVLAMDGELLEAAMQRAAECSVFYSHTRPNGLSCSSISPGAFGENIAASTGMKFSTADAVVGAWMNSTGHRQNILNAGYRSIGIGCFYKDGVWYWAQTFGRGTASPAVRKSDGQYTFAVQALQRYTSPFLVVEHHNMEKGQQIQYLIRIHNMGWANATAYIDQDSYQWSSDAAEIAVSPWGVVTALDWGGGRVAAANLGNAACRLTGTVDIYTDAVIETAGEVYVQQSDYRGLVAGLPLTLSRTADVEYSWYAAADGEDYQCISDWTENYEWLSWKPGSCGDYKLAVSARVAGNTSSVVTKTMSFSYHPQIKGKCQMPNSGEGGGFLIGFETYDNPGQSYQYEMLILDCTLMAEGRDAWIYSTGRCRLGTGKALWTVWQPKYGYYWTLFRVYDERGTLLDEACYGFQNI